MLKSFLQTLDRLLTAIACAEAGDLDAAKQLRASAAPQTARPETPPAAVLDLAAYRLARQRRAERSIPAMPAFSSCRVEKP
jgi:hypothetical protein